jgi:putative membrane protein
MKLRLIRIGLALLGNALGLLIAAILLKDMHLSGAAFFLAVVIFTVVMLVLDPLVAKLAAKFADFLTSASALVSTLLGLILTNWLSDGLSIHGAGTWVLAAVIVWLGAAILGVVLAAVILKRFVKDEK